jgi:hypothetical protein
LFTRNTPNDASFAVVLGVLRVGDEALVAVDLPAAVDLLRLGLHPREIRATARFGQAEAHEELARGDARDDLLLQRVAAEGDDRGERRPRGEQDGGRAGAGARDLLEDDHLREQITSAAAELGRKGQAVQLERAEGVVGATRELGFLVDLDRVRADARVDQAADAGAERVVEAGVGHGSSRCSCRMLSGALRRPRCRRSG